MEEDLKRLIKKCDECKLNECINCEISYSDIQTIKHLIKAYKDLKEIEENHRQENGELRIKLDDKETELQILKDDIKADEIMYKDELLENYIPISLVQEKIEELEGMLTHELTRNDGFSEYREYALDILQELLEKRR